jgi:hypothetical protein
VRLLMARLEEPDRSVEKVHLPPTFVHRDSCGCSIEGEVSVLGGISATELEPSIKASGREKRPIAHPRAPRAGKSPLRPTGQRATSGT